MTDTITDTAPWYPEPADLSEDRFRHAVAAGTLSTRAVLAVSLPRSGESPETGEARQRVACRRARLWLALAAGDAAVAEPHHLHASGPLAVPLLQRAVASGIPVLDWPDPALLLQAAAVAPPDMVLWTVRVDTRALGAAAS